MAQPMTSSVRTAPNNKPKCPCKLAQDLFIERDNCDATVLRICLVVFSEFVDDHLKFRRRGRKFHAGFKPHEGKPIILLRSCGYRGQVDVRVAPREARRYYTNYSVELVIELDRFVENVPAATELVLPEKIAEHRDGCGITAGRVRGRKFAAKKRRDAHKLEQIGGIETNIYRDRDLISGEILLRALLKEDILNGRSVANGGKSGAIGEEQRTPAIFVVELNVNHAVVIFVGIGVEEYAIDNAEYRCGRTDAQHQRENRGKHEAWCFSELAEAKAQVLKKGPHKEVTSDLDVLLDEREMEADSSERFS